MYRFLALAVPLLALPAWAALDDYQRAREALERNEVIPLAEILESVQGRIDARIIEVEFEQLDGRPGQGHHRGRGRRGRLRVRSSGWSRHDPRLGRVRPARPRRLRLRQCCGRDGPRAERGENVLFSLGQGTSVLIRDVALSDFDADDFIL